MSGETLTHKDLSKIAGVSETTIKSYRRKFGSFFPVVSAGKPIRFAQEAGPLVERIRELFQENLSVGEIEERLRAEFREFPKNRHLPRAGKGPIDDEVVEQFFVQAGRMMQGMAQLATAQAKAEKRLEKLEHTLEELLDAERRSSERQAELVDEMKTLFKAGDPKVKARKIVKVRGAEGRVDEYSLEDGPETGAAGDMSPEAGKADGKASESPDAASRGAAGPAESGAAESGPGIERTAADTTAADAAAANAAAADPEPTPANPPLGFLARPVAIRSERGEFLGVPGRMPLRDFAQLLVRRAGGGEGLWFADGEGWMLRLNPEGEHMNELRFVVAVTPRGNEVALFETLMIGGKVVSQAFLQEYFRQIKDSV